MARATGKDAGIGQNREGVAREKTSEETAPAKKTFEETAPLAGKTSEETPAKRSSAVVRSFGEEARRSKIDAEAQRRVDLALKLERLGGLEKLEGLRKLKKAKKSAPQRDFPFGKPRRRTFRASDPPRRFDDPRRDEEDGQN